MLQRYMKLLMLLAIGLSLTVIGCKPKDKPFVEKPPVVEQPKPEPEPQPEPEPEPEPQRVLKATEFQTVYFDLDKFNLRSDARSALDADLALLREFPDVMIKIEGHADERGTIEYNLSLGEKRAGAAMEYLVSQGIDSGRISTISYGKERPVDTGHNESAWAKNRRCEFRIISQ